MMQVSEHTCKDLEADLSHLIMSARHWGVQCWRRRAWEHDGQQNLEKQYEVWNWLCDYSKILAIVLSDVGSLTRDRSILVHVHPVLNVS